MANPLVESPIPLAGSGFVAKRNGNFQPGEFKRLCNLEITPEGVIVNRRNMNHVTGSNSGSYAEAMANPQRFIGSMGEYSIVGLGELQVMVGSSTFQYLWDLTALGPAGASSYSQFLGFFRYNNKNFWLVFEFDSAVSVSLVLYHDAEIPVPDIPETYAAGYEAGLTRTVILTFASDTTDFFEFQFKNFFIYKERLWIATTVGLYFSAATDPTNFVAPDGGFFKHPGNRVNYALAIKDNIYTLCDDAVYALTYNTDPNLDSTERPLSDIIGGEMGCVHLDTVYFINNQGIYVINGNNVDKVMDSNFDYGRDTYANHIYSFQDYLIVNKYQPVNYDNNYSPPARVTTRKNLISAPESDTVGGTQIISGWAVSGSPDVRVRSNYQANSNLNLDPDPNTFADFFKNTFGTDYLMGQDTPPVGNPDAGAFCGYLVRSSAAGVADIGFHNWIMGTTAGRKDAFSLKVWALGARNVRLQIVYQNAAQVTIQSTNYDQTTPAGWSTVSRVSTAPAGAFYVYFNFWWLGLGGTERHYFDNVLVESNCDTIKSYFDGDYADTTFKTYSWAGTPNQTGSNLDVKTSIMNAITGASDGISSGKVLRFGGTFVDATTLDGKTPFIYANCIKTFTIATPLANGIPYTLRFDHKGNGSWTSGMGFYALLEFLDAANVTKGNSVIWVSTNYLPSSSYGTLIATDVVFPVGTTKLKINLSVTFDPTGKTSTTPWSIDINKIHLEKSSTYSGYFTGATTDTVDVTYSWVGTAFASESTTGSATTHSYLKNNGNKFEPFLEGNSLGYNTYFINTLNGACHVLDFIDQNTDFAHGSAGFIVDALVNPYSDDSGNDKIFFLTNKLVNEDESGLDFNSFVYYMSSSESIEVYDYVVDSASILRRRAPKFDLEIDSYVPDGFEHRIKKFRSLLLQGVIPPNDMQLQVAYNNEGAYQITSLGDDDSVYPEPRKHYAHRIGLNQRGHAITFRLNNPNWSNEIAGSFGILEISDLRVLWTYIQRFATTRNIGS